MLVLDKDKKNHRAVFVLLKFPVCNSLQAWSIWVYPNVLKWKH